MERNVNYEIPELRKQVGAGRGCHERTSGQAGVATTR